MIFRQVDKTVEPVLPDDVRNVIRTAAENGSFVISEAVLSSLRDRGLSYRDVRNVLAQVEAALPQDSGWTVSGTTMDGERMTLTVAIDSGTVMVI